MQTFGHLDPGAPRNEPILENRHQEEWSADQISKWAKIKISSCDEAVSWKSTLNWVENVIKVQRWKSPKKYSKNYGKKQKIINFNRIWAKKSGKNEKFDNWYQGWRKDIGQCYKYNIGRICWKWWENWWSFVKPNQFWPRPSDFQTAFKTPQLAGPECHLWSKGRGKSCQDPAAGERIGWRARTQTPNWRKKGGIQQKYTWSRRQIDSVRLEEAKLGLQTRLCKNGHRRRRQDKGAPLQRREQEPR